MKNEKLNLLIYRWWKPSLEEKMEKQVTSWRNQGNFHNNLCRPVAILNSPKFPKHGQYLLHLYFWPD